MGVRKPRTKEEEEADGPTATTSQPTYQLASTATIPAVSDVRHRLRSAWLKIFQIPGNSSAYEKVTYQFGAGAETLLYESLEKYPEDLPWEYEHTCDIAGSVNEQLIIRWYLRRQSCQEPCVVGATKFIAKVESDQFRKDL